MAPEAGPPQTERKLPVKKKGEDPAKQAEPQPAASGTKGKDSPGGENGASSKTLADRSAAPTAVQAGGGNPPPALPGANPLTLHPIPPRAQRPGEPRSLRSIFWSAFFFVGIPTLLGVLYFGVLASDQYATRADFIIKMRATPPASAGGASLLGGMSAVNPMSIGDMLVVKEYVASGQILKDIALTVDIGKIYSTPKADRLARLGKRPDFRRILTGEVWEKGLWAPVSDEDLLEYWKKMVMVNFDLTTGISSLEVRAFTPDDSMTIANVVLGLGESLVNQLSDRSQADALTFARKEVQEAHERATEALDSLQAYQQEAKQVDPEGFAKARSEIQAKLESDLSQFQSQLDILRKDLPENAPGIQQIKNRIVVLQEQLIVQKLQSTKSPSRESAGEVLNEFSKRKLDVDFSTKAYMSALSSLETARLDAAQQSRYLEAFVRPQLPQRAEYPKRLQAVLIVFFGSAVLWAIGRLFIAVAKEHL